MLRWISIFGGLLIIWGGYPLSSFLVFTAVERVPGTAIALDSKETNSSAPNQSSS
jgi:hypothetical protein